MLEPFDVVLLQLEVPLPTVLHTVALAKKLGKIVLMNPAPAPQQFDDKLIDVDVFCPNRSEAERILHKKILNRQDALLAVQSLVKLGAASAIITLGEEGAVVAQAPNKSEWIPACDIVPVDSTAAGDAFMGALAFKLSQRLDLIAAAQFASAAGACAVTVAGAQPSLPTLNEVEAMVRRNLTVDDFSKSPS